MSQEAPESSEKKRESPVIGWAFTVYALLEDPSSPHRDLYYRAAMLLEPNDWPDIRYLLIGFETCPNTGKNHLQGYLQLTEKKRFKQLKKLFTENGFDDVHLEHARENAATNIKYCKKDGFFEEWGKPLRMGQRTDIECVTSDILDGNYPTILSMAHAHPIQYVRYHLGLEKLWSFQPRPLRSIPSIYEFSGPPGCGKTTGARYFLTQSLKINTDQIYEYCDDPAGPWWQGYYGQTVVIFEDFKANYPLNSLLRILDSTRVQVPLKGTSVPLQADTFIFTCNHPLEDYYFHNDQYPAWIRRLKEFMIRMPPRLLQPDDPGFICTKQHKLNLQTNKNQYLLSIK